MLKLLTAARLRQLAGVVVSIYGVLTASVPGLRLPVAVSTVLTLVGPIIIVLQHYLADPSTGNPVPVPPSAPTVPGPAPTATPGVV